MRSTTPTIDSARTSPRPASSFLSKVTTPFTARKRNLTEFTVETDEPHRQYSPGEVVKGSVNIRVDKAVNITHVVVCLHGFVKVFNNARAPGQSVPRDGAPLGTGNGTGKKGAEYFGNGFASLFEDEVTLCGQGRLVPARYKFRFELELPSDGLPSSIDFERGTITYMLTSTLTRPTTISPMYSCHWKIKVIESIDVALSQQPKSQTISLEAINRGNINKNKNGMKRIAGIEASQPLRVSGDPPQSPAPSERSSISTTSSGLNWQVRSIASSARSTDGDDSGMYFIGLCGIHATIEILRSGCLPGDSLPIQVSVTHTKAIKSLQGIIVTLYRLARVDTHPAIPLGPKHRDNSKKPEYEDYYPKSRTGLGGLSLSSAGSSRTFRQDLNQTFAPLLVDPRSLTAMVKTSLQVPEDLFPTISNVPGEMISFKYYVEVVVDLRGKLAGQDRVRSQLGIVNGAGGYGHGDPKVHGVDGSSGLFFPLASGFGCLDTSQVRREKRVVSWSSEVIVGTHDSDRKRCKPHESVGTPTAEAGPQLLTSSVEDRRMGRNSRCSPPPHPERSSPYRHGSNDYFGIPRDIDLSPQYTESAQTTTIPPPDENPDDQDEKARIRRAEERLLPSEAPAGDEPATSAPTQPSAPEAIDEEDFILRYRMFQPMPAAPFPTSPQETIVPTTSQHSLILHSDTCLITSSGASESHDDKQELEMRRLQAQVSSPEAPEGTSTSVEPTAPILHSNLHLEAHGSPSSSHSGTSCDNLPVYKK